MYKTIVFVKLIFLYIYFILIWHYNSKMALVNENQIIDNKDEYRLWAQMIKVY